MDSARIFACGNVERDIEQRRQKVAAADSITSASPPLPLRVLAD